jgi:hypothetical protein
MEYNEELVLENTENVEEQATEELVDGAKVEEVEQPIETPEEKKYSESELNERVDKLLAEKLGKKTAIIERKLRREYDSKYGDLENVLKAGTGINDVKELTDTFTDFYTSKGKQIPTRNNYSESDLRILASAEAEDIISSGFEEVVEEVDRLAEKGLENMNPREKIMFQKLATYRQNKERENELASIGVTTDVLNNTEFTTFASQFNSNVPIKDVYTMWTKTQPTKKVEQMGSMKNTVPNKVKDYYTEDEISRLTLDDLNNPDVWNAVRKSMTQK